MGRKRRLHFFEDIAIGREGFSLAGKFLGLGGETDLFFAKLVALGFESFAFGEKLLPFPLQFRPLPLAFGGPGLSQLFQFASEPFGGGGTFLGEFLLDSCAPLVPLGFIGLKFFREPVEFTLATDEFGVLRFPGGAAIGFLGLQFLPALFEPPIFFGPIGGRGGGGLPNRFGQWRLVGGDEVWLQVGARGTGGDIYRE
ncbi:MAG: hypothetical protein RMJ56_05195, partial [Gemmataceae bacterium]|nr:hypothetical protein [Gemmata sp.]MDW8196987.1 hypothetical protein [Gemmataceae bacterium]